jgi:hypothetical protein
MINQEEIFNKIEKMECGTILKFDLQPLDKNIDIVNEAFTKFHKKNDVKMDMKGEVLVAMKAGVKPEVKVEPFSFKSSNEPSVEKRDMKSDLKMQEECCEDSGSCGDSCKDV